MLKTDAVAQPELLGPDKVLQKDEHIKVLHLSDTTLSGSPIRICEVTNRYSKRYVARHIVWKRKVGYREFETDMVGEAMTKNDLRDWLEWADVIHYHNRYSRQEIFKALGIEPPKKPSIIQMHSPRESENFSEEIRSKVPIAVVGQYHPRQWPEAAYIVPNVIDIWDEKYMPLQDKPVRDRPIVSYAPSNTNASGWDNKGYHLVAPHLKRLKIRGVIVFQLIIDTPHHVAIKMKQGADIGIDEIATGSYHLSSLEYLSMGVPCFANIDRKTQDVLCRMTGADTLPWIISTKDLFPIQLHKVMNQKSWVQKGKEAREWMERYWHPVHMVRHYEEMYDSL